MKDRPCQDCQELLSNIINKKHANLERGSLSKDVGFHGCVDDEYFYQCKVCGTRFIGDASGIWPEKN